MLRESVIKNSGGKILLNNTQKYHSINSTVWKCSYSIGTLYILNGGVQKKWSRLYTIVCHCSTLAQTSTKQYLNGVRYLVKHYLNIVKQSWTNVLIWALFKHCKTKACQCFKNRIFARARSRPCVLVSARSIFNTIWTMQNNCIPNSQKIGKNGVEPI